MALYTRPALKTRPQAPADKAPAAATERVSKTLSPKPRRDVGLAWLVLLGLLVLAAPPLLIEIGRPATWTTDEALAVAISTETFERKSPMADAPTSLEQWTPVYQGATRWDLPPGGAWLHQLMFAGTQKSPGDASGSADRAWVLRARLGSVAMTLLLITAVYWAGHSIGGVTTGVFSALVMMTMPLVIGFGRHATSDIAALAWSTLSIAAALWAMRPLRASPGLARQFIGWLVCGLALGLATLTAGPAAVPTTLLCTFVLAMLCPRRINHLLGIFASSSVAALLIIPWVLHVHDHDANIWQMWARALEPDFFEYGALSSLRRAGWRLSLAATLSGLWLVWLIPAVTQPFSTSTGKARRQMLLGWAWLVTAAILIALAPGQTHLSTLLIALAPASIAIGLVIQQFHDLSAEGRHARLWLICRWITIALMLLLAIALPVLGYLLNHRPEVVAALPTLEKPLLAKMHWSYYAGGGVALLLASGLAVRFVLGHHPGRTTACLTLWLMITSSLAIIPLSRGPLLSMPADLPASAPPAPANTTLTLP